ncbi:hypothetical protein [Spirosoma pollinicola]|uniref:Virulence factor Evf domain-containing protein n=1 Tax=Spirosoma pollinicola TaxID=2057025 RepID=A0A2K8Z187_9BACT|nr:hypothetical protein [Spirosoma pollinicola]AUD03662.1 hypothetical protein CWM47_18620 [Spirosoma pollinicola]
MLVHDPIQFVQDLEFEDAKKAFPSERGWQAPDMTEGVEQSFMNAKSLVSFVSDINGQRRSDVLNSVLLAQLAANKKFPDENQLVDWYKEFVRVLNNLGWAIEAAEFASFESSGTVFEAENAIISILTAAFGGSFMVVITKTLEALKGLSDSNGKISAFEKNTHSQSKGAFQIGLAREENGTVILQMGTFLLTSSNEIRKILFFKSTKDKTKLNYCSRTGTLNEDVYARIRTQIQDKLGGRISDFIAEIDL